VFWSSLVVYGFEVSLCKNDFKIEVFGSKTLESNFSVIGDDRKILQ
jgi:hypothetical protein